MYKLDIHADDYGLSESNARILIEAIKQGQLNSISIIPTMDCFPECMDMLKEAWDSFPVKPLITVHIDLVDGRSQADNSKFITNSWGSLFLASYFSLNKKEIKAELVKEIKAQIVKVVDALPQMKELRLDSHMHTHMIPIVADAMWEAYDIYAEESGADALPLKFVRIAREPAGPFLKKTGLYKTYSPINFVKNMILNILAGRIERQCKNRGLEKTLLWGLIMSGNMDIDRVKTCFNSVCDVAKKKDRYLEILFHPAGIMTKERQECHNKDDIAAFYLAEGRKTELNAIQMLREFTAKE